MKFLLSVVVIAVLAYTGYTGYRRGIVSSLLEIVTVVISIYLAFLISNTYSGEFLGLVSPFAGGLVDSVITDTLEHDYIKQPAGTIVDTTDSEDSSSKKISIMLAPVIDLTNAEKKDPYTVCFASLLRLGIEEDAAKKIAARVDEQTDSVGQKFIDIASKELSVTICRAVIFTIAFILTMIIFVVIGNILNFNFGLPGLERVNNIGGAVSGVIKGIILIMFVACLMRYVGLVISQEKLSGIFLFGKFIAGNLIALKVGI